MRVGALSMRVSALSMRVSALSMRAGALSMRGGVLSMRGHENSMRGDAISSFEQKFAQFVTRNTASWFSTNLLMLPSLYIEQISSKRGSG